MSADALSRRDRAHLLCPLNRRLHPAPGRCGVRLDYSALPDITIRERARERRVQLRMNRNEARLPALAGPDSKSGMRSVERQVAHFEVERLGHPQACSPLFEHQELRLRIGGEADDGVDLFGFEVLGELFDALRGRAILGLGIPSARASPSYNFGRQGQNPPGIPFCKA